MPPASSSSPVPSAAPAPVAPSLESLPVVWSHPWGGYEPAIVDTPAGRAVLTVEPGGRAAVLLDARTGAVRWTATAPKDVEWTKAIVAGTLWLVDGYRQPQGAALSRLVPATGAIAWTRYDPEGEPSIGSAGSGIEVFSSGRCQSRLLDPATGRSFGAPMRGRDIEMFGHGRMPPGHRCDHVVTLFGMVDDVGVVAHEPAPRRWILEGIDTGGRSRWKLPIGEERPHGLHFEGGHALFVEGTAANVLRVDMRSGRIVWKRPMPDGASCDDRGLYPMIRSGPGWGGKASRLLVSSCASASLWDTATGKVLWSRPTAGASPVIVSVTPDHPDDSELRFLDMAPAIRWFTSEGEAAGSAALPQDVNGVFPMGEVVVVEPAGFQSVMGVGRDGATKWEHRLGESGGSRVGDWFVTIVGRDNTQVLIRPADGKARKLAAGSPYVLGEASGVKGEPGVFITTRRPPDEIVGLRL